MPERDGQPDDPRTALRDDGFAVLPGLLPREDVARLQREAEAATRALSSAHRERYRSNGTLENLADHEGLARVALSHTIMDALRGLGATDPRWTSGYLISKPPGGAPLFWHQDWWGWGWEASYDAPAPQLFVMIYLVETSPSNGCLRVIPGSHRRAHELHDLGTAHGQALAAYDDPADPAYADHPDQRAVPVTVGDVVVGDARLIHGAYPNRSDTERPLLTLWYAPGWDRAPPALRARFRQIYERADLDVEDRRAPERTPDDWSAAARARLSGRVPDKVPGEAPEPWRRTPDPARLRPSTPR